MDSTASSFLRVLFVDTNMVLCTGILVLLWLTLAFALLAIPVKHKEWTVLTNRILTIFHGVIFTFYGLYKIFNIGDLDGPNLLEETIFL